MAWGTPDVYYQPEKFGLTPVAELSFSDEPYEFDFRVAWKHEDGTLYTARDSGCSCPSPFEDFTSLEQLDKVDLDALRAEIDEFVKRAAQSRESGYSPWGYPQNFELDASQFISAIEQVS